MGGTSSAIVMPFCKFNHGGLSSSLPLATLSPPAAVPPSSNGGGLPSRPVSASPTGMSASSEPVSLSANEMDPQSGLNSPPPTRVGPPSRPASSPPSCFDPPSRTVSSSPTGAGPSSGPVLPSPTGVDQPSGPVSPSLIGVGPLSGTVSPFPTGSSPPSEPASLPPSGVGPVSGPVSPSLTGVGPQSGPVLLSPIGEELISPSPTGVVPPSGPVSPSPIDLGPPSGPVSPSTNGVSPPSGSALPSPTGVGPPTGSASPSPIGLGPTSGPVSPSLIGLDPPSAPASPSPIAMGPPTGSALPSPTGMGPPSGPVSSSPTVVDPPSGPVSPSPTRVGPPSGPVSPYPTVVGPPSGPVSPSPTVIGPPSGPVSSPPSEPVSTASTGGVSSPGPVPTSSNGMVPPSGGRRQGKQDPGSQDSKRPNLPGPSWTFNKVGYVSRTQLVDEEGNNENNPNDMSENRFAAGGREADKRLAEARKRELLVLVYQHLRDEGLGDAASTLAASLPWEVTNYEVCDNVDLKIVLSEYESYYQLKFTKRPNLCKKNEAEGASELKRKRPHHKSQMKRSSSVGLTKESSLAGKGPPVKEYEDLKLTGKSFMESEMEKKELMIPPAMLISEETRELALWLSRDAVTTDQGVTWDSIIGHHKAKQSLEECVLYPLKFPHLFASLKESRMFSNSVNSILLFGPPGTGKTMLARAVASKFDTTFFNIRCSSLASKWRGESEKLVRLLFQLAHYNAPATIFMDEADAILSERGTIGEHEASRRCKAELLVQLDGLEQDGKDKDLLFLASTNLPWSIDPAILRRFHKRILVDLPDKPERGDILSNCLRTPVTCPPPGPAIDKMAVATEGYSGSDLTSLCREATMEAIRTKLEDNTKNNDPHRLDITVDMLKQARDRVKPSDSCQKKFQEWNNKFVLLI